MKKALGLFLFLFFLIPPNYGQIPYFQNYFLLKKNEPVQVNAILQDKTGFIWYGTKKGLFRFDGINYRRFTMADSLPDENVTALAQDSIGRMWIGLNNGRLMILEKGHIHPFNPPEGSSTFPISDILFDRNGNLWFSTLNDGLYYFTQQRLYQLDETDGMPDLYIYDIAEDQQGNIWAGTDGGVVMITLNGKEANLKVLNYKNGLPDNIIKKLVPGEDHTMWMGTEDSGVINYDPVTKQYKTLVRMKWPYGAINDFLFSGNQVWISSLETGLVVYDRKEEQIKIYNANAGPGFTSINTLLKDREGNIWAGSKTGVMRTLGDQLEYIETLNPAKDVNVVALAIDKQGSIWFSNSEGLFKRRVDQSGTAITERQLVNTPYRKYTIISLFVDSDGYIWAGLYGEGAIRINPVTNAIRHLNHELRNGNILSITGKGNAVWLATLGGGTRINIEGEQLTIQNYGSGDGLITDYIYQVFIDSQNRVWFATDGKGVDRLDAAGFHHYQKGLNSKVVYGFAEDSDHTIWVNVQGDGLYQFDGSAFVPFGKKTPLRDNNINGFSSDQFGNLVVMHDLGIDIYDVRKNRIRYLGDEIGIRDKKTNLNAVAKDDHGRIFFGTDEGIIRYAPIGDQSITSPVPVISGLNVFDQAIDFSGSLSFSYDQNDITVSYLGIWYQNPSALSFQYRLENYDRDWISSRDHSATYSSLPPGSYIFRLKVSDTSDFKDAREATLQFVVLPPFWRTTGFYLLSILVAGFSIYAFIRYRERRLQKDKKLLEAKVQERTLEIQKKNDEIQTISEEIQAQSEEIMGFNENLEALVKDRTRELEMKNRALEEYAFINAHELRAPVASILGLINLMRTVELKESEKLYLEHLQRSADKLDAVVTSITLAIEKGDKGA